ncbi:MAG TPA: hypothetical protein VND21_11935, partial [Planctomycetota bacterium]|nr:hypothetical protein [Planctomycetota bacterium]
MKDTLGRDVTPVEQRLVDAYTAIADLLKTPGLAPTTEANLKEAAAALFVAMNELALVAERPDALGL